MHYTLAVRVTISERAPTTIAADAYLVLIWAPARGRPRLPEALRPHLREDAAKLISTRAEGLCWLETRDLSTPRVAVYCLGEAPTPFEPGAEYLGGYAGSFDRQSFALRLRRSLRNAGAALERACDALGLRHVVLADWPEGCDPGLVAEGMALRAHDPRAWEDGAHAPRDASSLRRLSLCLPITEARPRKLARAQARQIRERLRVVEATNFARLLGDLPGNEGTAAGLVERLRGALDDGRGPGLELSTISAEQAAAMGMGLFCAVDAGAAERGCILRLEHRATRPEHDPEAQKRRLILLGKGLTHDTGGYNLKTSTTIHELTHDKCGATAVIGAMLAIAELGLELDVIALCPLTENCIDSQAYKPGDVLTACDGTRVYVENTDAEGRLVLADLLAWLRGQEPYPDLVVDLATLTGAIHAALGEPFAGLFCNDDRARELLLEAGRISGDQLWPMPIHEIHDRDLGHHKADIRNVGVASGSPSAAAAFLRAFTDYPWAHVDLAGKAHAEFARECYGPGATGFGARLLVELARRLAAL